MKKVFICEICGEQYDKAEASELCEKSHWNFDDDKIDLNGINVGGYMEDYDAQLYIIVPMVRIFNGREEHCKMRFVNEGYEQERIVRGND